MDAQPTGLVVSRGMSLNPLKCHSLLYASPLGSFFAFWEACRLLLNVMSLSFFLEKKHLVTDRWELTNENLHRWHTTSDNMAG